MPAKGSSHLIIKFRRVEISAGIINFDFCPLSSEERPQIPVRGKNSKTEKEDNA